MKIERLDHLVLTVRNVEDACHFYSTVLGMEIVFFESGQRALSFGNQKINLHEAGSEITPHAGHPTVGSADLCFISDTPLPAVVEHLRPFGVKVEGPADHMGANGKIRSIYFRDPDNNLIEVGEYIEQQAGAAADKKSSALVPPPPLAPDRALAAPDVGLRFNPLPPPPSRPDVAVPVGAGGPPKFEPLPPPPPVKKS
jgi:catechol 2,3-dioxygenase-like lactoylglutathione lyase family enzyme